MPNALLMVRLMTSRGRPGSSESADGVPARANSSYASSTTSTPVRPWSYDRASYSASTVSSATAVPVGLFGLVTKTTSGRSSRTCAAAAVASMVKSSRRWPSTQAVPVPAEMIGCIE